MKTKRHTWAIERKINNVWVPISASVNREDAREKKRKLSLLNTRIRKYEATSNRG